MLASPLALARRRDLGLFLRERRSRLQPGEFGIKDAARRHVAGLRREEVAAIAGISTTWYTWIEQGRHINVSVEVLQQVGSALRLQPHELEYVESLVRDSEPDAYDPTPAVPPALRNLIELHTGAPAYIATPRLDLLVWNRFMSSVMGYESGQTELERNVLWRFFNDAARRSLYLQWEENARGSVAHFRRAYERYRGRPLFESFLKEMLKNADFKRIWELREIGRPGLYQSFTLKHPKHGVFQVTPIQATVDCGMGLYMCVYACELPLTTAELNMNAASA